MFGKTLQLLLPLLGAALVASKDAPKAEPVRLGVYEESYCPACISFMIEQLAPLYRELKDIMEVYISTYGFAKDWPEGEGYTFECQHGDGECVGNQVLGCAKKYIPTIGELIDYSDCFMSQNASIYGPQPLVAGEKCAEDMGYDWSVIGGCATSVEGQVIHHEAGLEFKALDPRPLGVPYTTINGKLSYAAYFNLKKTVCDTYEGPTPPACLE